MHQQITSLMKSVSAYLALASLAVLVGCSGGAGTEQNPNTNGTASAASYTGPAPQSADVQAFKNNLWVNISGSNRCGACHTAGGQSPQFARSDDVNLAYQAAIQLVNLADPSQSHLVAKVGGGHNCWLSSAASCADIMTTWIRNWANASGTAGVGTQIQLTAPADKTVGSSKTFPTSPNGFQTLIYDPILHRDNLQYCSRCHSPSAATPQKPYFASGSIDEAYSEAQAKINLDDPAQSRFVLRLRDESHNCWSDCAANAQTMQDAITAFANGITPTQVDPALVLSKAVTMYDGTVASGGNRDDSHAIARYVFKEGTGTVANDTSGVDPAINLTFSGSVSWVGGWGINLGTGGKAQALTAANKKLSDKLKASGEFSIEVWAAPANVAQEDAYIVSYSGGTMARNFTLAQKAYQYEAMTRSSSTDGNGEPSMLTKDANRDAQASLQHVVLTYDPVNGRRLFVNGNRTGGTSPDMDPVKGGSIASWDDTFALVLGNETSSDRQWLGVIKMVAIHDKALSLDQIQQNFAAGVGERYFVLFNVSSLTGVAQSYVMFEVSQYDSYSYLFNKPTFISLDANAKPDNIPIKGMRIGINGAEAPVGQAYIPLNTTISTANYKTGTGQLLSNVGTIVALQKGPSSDLFFLTFEQIGSQAHAVTEPAAAQPAPPVDSAAQPDVGVRTFGEINATMSKITGVPTTNASVQQTYALVKQQLPTVENIKTFVAAQQIGIAQLAISYCSALVDNTTLRASFFPGLNISSNLSTSADRDLVINPLVAKTLGSNLATQPNTSFVHDELDNLITQKLCVGGCTNPATRTPTVVKATCAAALASAAATLQ
jgi:hypothetical protein